MRSLIVFVLLAAHSWAAIAFVQAANGENATGTNVSVVSTGALSTTTGNLLVVFTRSSDNCGGTNTITDTASNTWTTVNTSASGDPTCVGMYYAKNITGNASNVVTVTRTGPGIAEAFWAISVVEFSGVNTTSPLDASATGAALSSSVTSGSFTTTTADQVLVAGVQHSNTSTVFTPGSGYTIPSGATNAASYLTAEYKIVSSIQTGVTASASFNSSVNSNINVGTFKMAAAANIRHRVSQ